MNDFTWHSIKTEGNPPFYGEYIVSYTWKGSSGTTYEEVAMADYDHKKWDVEIANQTAKVIAWMNKPDFYNGD